MTTEELTTEELLKLCNKVLNSGGRATQERIDMDTLARALRARLTESTSRFVSLGDALAMERCAPGVEGRGYDERGWQSVEEMLPPHATPPTDALVEALKDAHDYFAARNLGETANRVQRKIAVLLDPIFKDGQTSGKKEDGALKRFQVLRGYVRHKEHCNMEAEVAIGRKCTCGLEQALSSPPASKAEGE